MCSSDLLRVKQLLEALVRHLHAFVREVRLSEDEWKQGIDFLTAVGHITDERRQEFILLSDTLGVSMVVDLITHRFMPAGVAVVVQKQLPFPDSGVSATVEAHNVCDSLVIEWPQIGFTYDISSYTYGALA